MCKSNRFRALAIVLAILVSLFSFSSVFATSGACSYHGGVSCGSGADWDGSVICNDGWRESSVSYNSMVMCQGYGSYNYPSYQSTPSCPSNSSYDSYSDSCKCYSGYIVKGNSCVSGLSYCWSEYGINSTYDSLSKQCECNYGYALDKYEQCTSFDSLCHDQVGYSSRYNSLTDKCECDYGYELDSTGECTYKTSTYSVPDYSTSTCPSNASYDEDEDRCFCNVGYVVNSSKTACIKELPVVTPAKEAPVTKPVINSAPAPKKVTPPTPSGKPKEVKVEEPLPEDLLSPGLVVEDSEENISTETVRPKLFKRLWGMFSKIFK